MWLVTRQKVVEPDLFHALEDEGQGQVRYSAKPGGGESLG